MESAIAAALRQRGVDVLTVQEDGLSGASDEVVLERATALGRLLYTQDRDFLAIAASRQRLMKAFSGIAYAQPLRVSIGVRIAQLEFIALVSTPADCQDHVFHLPLQPVAAGVRHPEREN